MNFEKITIDQIQNCNTGPSWSLRMSEALTKATPLAPLEVCDLPLSATDKLQILLTVLDFAVCDREALATLWVGRAKKRRVHYESAQLLRKVTSRPFLACRDDQWQWSRGMWAEATREEWALERAIGFTPTDCTGENLWWTAKLSECATIAEKQQAEREQQLTDVRAVLIAHSTIPSDNEGEIK